MQNNKIKNGEIYSNKRETGLDKDETEEFYRVYKSLGAVHGVYRLIYYDGEIVEGFCFKNIKYGQQCGAWAE